MALRDTIQEQLDAVTKRLARPAFLKNLTPSRLPSQAASETSVSPKDREPHPHHHHPHHYHHHQGHTRACSFTSPLKGSPLATSFPESEISEKSFHSDALTKSTSLLTFEHGSKLILDSHHDAYQELRDSEAKARQAWINMAANTAFQPFDHGHQDLILAVDFNFFGTRMVTASSDHRLKVWDRKDDAWTLVDTWRAHDAEVVDVKWNGPFMGEVIGSIGEDGRFKLWQEDVTEVANSGRRFKLIYNQVSETKVPFMSLDFKNIMQETWVALISRDGYLTIYEPTDHSNLSEWQVMAQTHVVATPPSRSEETSFRVCFHHEQLPCWTAIQAGLDRRALSLAVVAMDVVKVYRTDKQRRFYVAAELTGARNLLRDVAWANGSMRGSDIIATASKDGMIRIYDLSTPEPTHPPGSLATPSAPEPAASPRGRGGSRNAPSGIGAGLAGATRLGESAHDNDQDPGRVKHVVKLVAELLSKHGAVWRVTFSQMGDLMISTGDDGTIRTWKKASSNRWLEYSEIDASKEPEPEPATIPEAILRALLRSGMAPKEFYE